jgi:6-phosphogluconate dehydrogenase
MVDEKGSRPETRHRRLKEKGFRFVDLGTSGGVEGARSGACFMAGGEAAAVEPLLQVLQMLSVEGGYGHAGPPGAGHFVKLVHNGIEFSMLQAIAEGIDLISHYRDDLDIPGVLRCWRNGSVVRSLLMDLMQEMLESEGSLETVPAYVEDTGEVNWLVDDAMHRTKGLSKCRIMQRRRGCSSTGSALPTGKNGALT